MVKGNNTCFQRTEEVSVIREMYKHHGDMAAGTHTKGRAAVRIRLILLVMICGNLRMIYDTIMFYLIHAWHGEYEEDVQAEDDREPFHVANVKKIVLRLQWGYDFLDWRPEILDLFLFLLCVAFILGMRNTNRVSSPASVNS